MPDAAVPLVETVVEDARWQAAGLPAVAERAAWAALAEAGREPARYEISLLGCDDARIAGLNAGFRGKPRPTNVLSWPAFDTAPPSPGDAERLFLGDLALAFETCAQEADEAGIPLADHAAHLIVHGVLHLLAYDHDDNAEAEAMEAIETKTLASMGLPDPYSR